MLSLGMGYYNYISDCTYSKNTAGTVLMNENNNENDNHPGVG